MIHIQRSTRAYAIVMGMLCSVVLSTVAQGDLAKQRQTIVQEYRAYQNASAGAQRDAARKRLVTGYRTLIDSMPGRKGQDAIDMFLNKQGIDKNILEQAVTDEDEAPILARIRQGELKARATERWKSAAREGRIVTEAEGREGNLRHYIIELQDRINGLGEAEQKNDQEATRQLDETRRAQQEAQQKLTEAQARLLTAPNPEALVEAERKLKAAEEQYQKGLKDKEEAYKRLNQRLLDVESEKVQLLNKIKQAEAIEQELIQLRAMIDRKQAEIQPGSAEDKELKALKAKLEVDFANEKLKLTEEMQKLGATNQQLEEAVEKAKKIAEVNIADLRAQLLETERKLQQNADRYAKELEHERTSNKKELEALQKKTIELENQLEKEKKLGNQEKADQLELQLVALEEIQRRLGFREDVLKQSEDIVGLKNRQAKAPLEETLEKLEFLAQTRVLWPKRYEKAFWGNNATQWDQVKQLFGEALAMVSGGTTDANAGAEQKKVFDYLDALAGLSGQSVEKEKKEWQNIRQNKEGAAKLLASQIARDQKAQQELIEKEAKLRKEREKAREDEEAEAKKQAQNQPNPQSEPKPEPQPRQSEQEKKQDVEAKEQEDFAKSIRGKFAKHPDLVAALDTYLRDTSPRRIGALILAGQSKNLELSREERELLWNQLDVNSRTEALKNGLDLTFAQQKATGEQPAATEEEQKQAAQPKKKKKSSQKAQSRKNAVATLRRVLGDADSEVNAIINTFAKANGTLTEEQRVKLSEAMESGNLSGSDDVNSVYTALINLDAGTAKSFWETEKDRALARERRPEENKEAAAAQRDQEAAQSIIDSEREAAEQMEQKRQREEARSVQLGRQLQGVEKGIEMAEAAAQREREAAAAQMEQQRQQQEAEAEAKQKTAAGSQRRGTLAKSSNAAVQAIAQYISDDGLRQLPDINGNIVHDASLFNQGLLDTIAGSFNADQLKGSLDASQSIKDYLGAIASTAKLETTAIGRLPSEEL